MVHNTQQGVYAIRHGDRVLIDAKTGDARPVPAGWMKKHATPPDDKQPVELYDLAKDPGQRKNLAAEQPEAVAELRALLKKIRDQGYSAPRLENP
jgi:arylsulfatase A